MRRPHLCLLYSSIFLALSANIVLNRVMTFATPLATTTAALQGDESSHTTSRTKRNVAADTSSRITPPSTNVTLHQQPKNEAQNVVFRLQPQLRLTTDMMPFGENATTINIFYVIATLKNWFQVNETDDGGEKAQLLGRTNINFVNGWANFTDLAVSRMGTGYSLEFSVRSTSELENSTFETNLESSAFQVCEYPLKVLVSILSIEYSVKAKLFNATINLILWDFVKNVPAQSDTVNETEWRYIVALKTNGSPTRLSGNTIGSFPSGSNKTGPLKFNFASIGYRFQFNVSVDSPAFKSRIENLSVPFDALRPITAREKQMYNVTLTFNGSLDSAQVTEDIFITTFLNTFGRRYSDVRWRNPKVQNGGPVVVESQLEGRVEELNETKEKLWMDAKDHFNLAVGGVMFMMQKSLFVNGENYEETTTITDLTIYGFNIPTIFTIILMSFLCASFVIAVLLWQIREKRVMESYNRRVRSVNQKRQNGHVNTAFDSNESIRERNEVYRIALQERAKLERERARRGCSEADPLRRCSSGGIPRYKYYRRVNARLSSDDEDTLGAVSGFAYDDDIVFADNDRHDAAFPDVFFSPHYKRRPTISSMTSSVHDDYYLRDAPGPSSRSQHRSSRRKCSVSASTPSESMCSLPNTSRSVSKVMVNSTAEINSYTLPRPPSLHWSSKDEKRVCNGKAVTASSSAIC